MSLSSCIGTARTTITEMPDGARMAKVDDTLFAEVLSHVLQTNGSVSYNALRSDAKLTDYLQQLALVRTDIFISRQAELAFWLNAHNAYVLDIIRSNWPVHSISDIPGFRVAKIVLIGGTHYSLEDIEHEILATHFREPRVFFGLFDGTRSSPPLRPEPYSEAHLSDELDHQLLLFLGDSTKNFVDRKGITIYLSELFKQYSNEIEAAAGTMTTFLSVYAPPEMARWVNAHPTAHISYLDYNNTLFTNDVPENGSATEQPARNQPIRKSPGGTR
ncbi:MAG TPA: DUF547 domain-containing protein [Candidatus Kapabacteria bacterium]|nr:DUF547 domain-containing protein [Candidatus Kapabacteria bacterium]